MKENWYAFAAAIINEELSVDKALLLMGINLHYTGKTRRKAYDKHDITDEDIAQMLKLREQNVPYKEIGKMYGVTDKYVFTKVKRYKERIAAA